MQDVTQILTVEQIDEMRARAMCFAHHLKVYGTEAADWFVDRYSGEWIPHAKAIREADAKAGMTTVRGFDTSTAPHDAVRESYPLVLYFGSKADADELVALIQEAKPGMVAVELEEGA